MKLELDQENVRTMMQMWRKAVDLEIPLSSDIRIHFLARRGQLLDGFVKLAGNWLMLFRHFKATGEDLVALDALETEIEEFKAWAEAGISELARLASEELGHPPPSTS